MQDTKGKEGTKMKKELSVKLMYTQMFTWHVAWKRPLERQCASAIITWNSAGTWQRRTMDVGVSAFGEYDIAMKMDVRGKCVCKNMPLVKEKEKM